MLEVETGIVRMSGLQETEMRVLVLQKRLGTF